MDRRLCTIVAIFGLILAFSGSKVSAHEGRIVLKNQTAACEGISIWRDTAYRIVGRCSGLVYPYQERVNKYVLWVREGTDAPRRVGNINLGMFDGRTTNVFSQVFITVEESTSPRTPGELVIASGNLQSLDFGTVANPTVQPLVPSALATPTPTPVSKAVFTAPSGITRRLAVGLAVVFGVIIAIVIGLFIVRRSR